MQNAKDSFYMALRARLAAINPERTCVLRGAVRPGILVEEAEAPFSQLPADVFVLRWLGIGTDVNLDAPMVAAECEIAYQTCGCQSFGGLDRGRALSAMDKELLSMLQPFSTPKLSFMATPPRADAYPGVLGRAWIRSRGDAEGSSGPVGQGHGLQLPGTG